LTILFSKRLEREKIEKELALKFSQQLHLDANRFSFVTAEQEPVIEEDEFPGTLFTKKPYTDK
jgi:hypothetical protein